MFFLLVSVLQPVIFASIAFFMVGTGSAEGRCSTSRSARVDGHLVGDALRLGRRGVQWQRWQGTLEEAWSARRRRSSRCPAADGGDVDDRDLLRRGDARLGRVFFEPLDFAHPLQLAVAACDHPQPRRTRPPARVDVRAHRQASAFSNLLSIRSGSPRGCSSRWPSCRDGWSRSPGCCHRPGACARSARRRSAETPGPRSFCVGLGLVYLALGALALRNFEAAGAGHATLSLT